MPKMSTRLFQVTVPLLVILAGCRHNAGPAGMESDNAVTSNTPLPSVTTNLLPVIAEEQAIEIARQEASRRGRTNMRVSERWFERGEWKIGLDFEPYDQVGNYAIVCITTNGIIRHYIRGR